MMGSRRKKRVRSGGTPHGEIDGLLRKAERRNRKRRKQLMVDWVFIGEGPEPSVACEYAKEHPDEKIVIVDPLEPEYQPPSNMKFVQMDALTWLNGRPGETVRNLRDDFTFESVIFEIGADTIGEQILGHIKTQQLMGEVAAGADFGQKLGRYVRNAERYCKLAWNALVHGGRFVFTATEQNKAVISLHLRKTGFNVETQQLSEQEVMEHESLEAKMHLQEGDKVFRITGTKPSKEEITGEKERQQKQQKREEFLRRLDPT